MYTNTKTKFIKVLFKALPIIAFILAAFCACAPAKRIKHILDRHPELKEDKTVILFDTVKIPGSRIDTIVNYHLHRDTITVIKDNITTKVFIHKDTVFISQVGKPRQIIKRIKVTVPQIIYKIDDARRWSFLWLGAAIACFIIIVLIIILFIYGPKKL